MRWLVIDTLYNAEAFYCGHLDSYGHYLAEAGEQIARIDLAGHVMGRQEWMGQTDVVFALDGYAQALEEPARIHIAQVACDTEVPPGFDMIISSIPALVEKYKARGENAVFQPLAFDTRARVCGMGVARDLDCIFIGSTGPNHRRRTALLEELRDIVTVLPPVYGREYFKTLARAKVVFDPHAEWARGAVNNMRAFEAAGMGAWPIVDGEWPESVTGLGCSGFGAIFDGTVSDARETIAWALRFGRADMETATVLLHHTYENRVPALLELARSL